MEATRPREELERAEPLVAKTWTIEGVPDQVSIGSDDGVVCCGSTGSMWREMTLSCGKIILLSH